MSTAELAGASPQVALALCLVTALTACPAAVGATRDDVEVRPGNQCVRQNAKPTPHTDADDILEGRIDVGPFDAVTMGTDLTWTEDPYEDANWRYRLHSMRWLKGLSRTYRATGDPKYLDAWRSYWLDWAADNPVVKPASPIAWDHHPTGLRAKLLACALDEFPDEHWIRPLLRTHAELLIRDDFYVNRGNHALNQAQGLLAAGCTLNEQRWIDIGMERIDALVADSITPDGSSNEGSIAYAAYNFDRYTESVERIQACGQPEPPLLRERLPMLATFVAHATLPNGEVPLIGDANAKRVPRWFSPEVGYASSLGAEGEPRAELSMVYPHGGWALGRTSWGRREMPDSVVYALRTGHASNIHSHDDVGHLSIFGKGRRLLEDSGLFAYRNPLNQYFYAPQAHNVVVVEPGTYRRDLGSQLATSRLTPRYDVYEMELTSWTNVRWTRRVLFSREGGWFIVDDRLRAGLRPRTFTQTWHLAPGSNPLLSGSTLRTRFARGNASITMLTTGHRLEVIEGRNKPIQGFIALKFGSKRPAPVLEASTPLTADSARFVALITTSSAARAPRLSGVQVAGGRIEAEIALEGRRDHVRWNGSDVVIECRSGCS